MPIDVPGDNRWILNDPNGFRQAITLTSPAGVAATYFGFATDIAELLDPETGQAVSGRRASVSLSLLEVLDLPAVVHESDRRPWLVSFVDARGETNTWKVGDVRPDRRSGNLVLIVEGYRAAAD